MSKSINDVVIQCPTCSNAELDITYIEVVVLAATRREQHKNYCVCKTCGQHFGSYIEICNLEGMESLYELNVKFLPSEPHDWVVDKQG